MNLCLKICFGVSQRKCLTTCVKYVMPVMSDFLRFDNRRELHGLIRKYTTSDLTSTSQLRKKPFKKKSIILKDSEALRVSAFTTAEEFNIENLKNNLRNSMKYKLTEFNSEFGDTDSVVHIVPTDSGCLESKDVFLFREGSVVLWNLNEDEILHLLQFLKNFHKDSFSDEIVKNEQESMLYVKSSELSKTILTGGKIILAEGENEILDKFAVSNAMALSVHLGAYESLLSEYIDSMFFVTEDLKSGRTIKMNQKEVLRKMGHLFALRHVINLSSDLLDTPDFYWDREELEKLYNSTFNYFCIRSRTKVMNEKINHCIELVQLLSTQLSDAHHVRLEWMIIALIMVEVAFEVFHYVVQFTTLTH